MIRVAIVEDNKIMRESLADYVQTDSELSCVCACATAEEALREVPKHLPDVVLMDIHLPNLSGIECTARLKKALPHLLIIMVTIYEDADRISKALRAGACGYLLKRSNPDQFVAAIREARLGGVPLTREIAQRVIGAFREPVVASAQLETLSPRERGILELLAQGLANKEIADRLGISDGTIRWHLRHVYNKLQVRSRTEAVLKFRQG